MLADAGYASDANLAARGPDRLIALSKGRDQSRTARPAPANSGPPPGSRHPSGTMSAQAANTGKARALYKRRGATVEPGIGNLKKILDRFSRRGLDAATSELHLAADRLQPPEDPPGGPASGHGRGHTAGSSLAGHPPAGEGHFATGSSAARSADVM